MAHTPLRPPPGTPCRPPGCHTEAMARFLEQRKAWYDAQEEKYYKINHLRLVMLPDKVYNAIHEYVSKKDQVHLLWSCKRARYYLFLMKQKKCASSAASTEGRLSKTHKVFGDLPDRPS